MAPPTQVEISIPNAEVASSPKPHTVYNITLRLPLRSFSIQKRFSDFTTLHSTLTSQASQAPPAPLPAKTWFSSTVSSPELTEERRRTLETYLRSINENSEARWRDTSAWRSFLNLPSNLSTKSSAASTLHDAITSTNSTKDPELWLDQYKQLKRMLQDAREELTKRDAAENTQSQHEAGANAKKLLVKSGTMISNLEQSLKKQRDEWGTGRLGDGEMRRRNDLVSTARKEKDTLESILSNMVAKSRVDAEVADKAALVNNSSNGNGYHGNGAGGRKPGRVLGKESAKTRELDNQGVLQLQQQMMTEQDEDVDILAKAIRRQKELAVQINQELYEQNDLLGLMEEDVDRVDGKIKIARKRIAKIS
ncbi:hypothetical protein MMC25_000923 [Agyrium rufum]|nr:hypothetical protein [Agyrium rufum]